MEVLSIDISDIDFLKLSFVNKEWLLLLTLIPIFIYFYIKISRRKKRYALKFSNIGLIKSSIPKHRGISPQSIIFAVDILIVILLIFSLADPHLPLKRTKKGVNVVLVIDVSGSMGLQDYKPSRLEAAKKAAEIFVKSLQSKDMAGIVVFSDGATTASHLTRLKERTLTKLRNIALRQGRTAIGDGLAVAVDMITSIPNKKKVVILLSDGVNNAGMISPDEAIKYAKSEKVQVFTVGIGSEKPVPIGRDWWTGQIQYAEPVDEQLLMKIAKETGGEYYRSVNEKTLEEIYSKLSKKIKREKEDTSIISWFLVVLLLLCLIKFYLQFFRYSVIP